MTLSCSFIYIFDTLEQRKLFLYLSVRAPGIQPGDGRALCSCVVSYANGPFFRQWRGEKSLFFAYKTH